MRAGGVGEVGGKTKKTKRTSKVTIKVEEESAWSLCGRGDQEEAECERKGATECFGPVF